jgi:hypothetical protein
MKYCPAACRTAVMGPVGSAWVYLLLSAVAAGESRAFLGLVVPTEEFRPAATQIQAEMSVLSRGLPPRTVAILRRSLAAISSLAETLDGPSDSR